MLSNNINDIFYVFNFSLYVYLIEYEGILFVVFFFLNMEFKMLGMMITIVVKSVY